MAGTVSPEAAPDAAEYIDLEFEKGDLVAIDGTRMKAHELLAKLNELGGKARYRTPRSGGKPLRRYEIPRLLLKPRAAPSCCVLIARSSRSRSTAKWFTSGRPHAALCQHHL